MGNSTNAVTRYFQAIGDMAPRARRGWIICCAGIFLLIAIDAVTSIFDEGAHVARNTQLLFALLPVLPLAVCVFGGVELYRFGDELQKRVMTEGALPAIPVGVILLCLAGALIQVEPEARGIAVSLWVFVLPGWIAGMTQSWKRNTGHPLGIPGDS